MCTTCGCGVADTRLDIKTLQQHNNTENPNHQRTHNTINAHGPTHAPGMQPDRMIKIERDILANNNQYANKNRHYLSAHGIFSLNLVSSPGSGKTSLLVKTIQALQKEQNQPLAVIEGDQQTDHDAARIRATNVPAIQINTGKGCHLDAHMISHAIQQLELQEDSLLFIENVGNLVCPASFDLGETHKVVILSVTEGEDKPLKYPDIFRAAGLMLLNKCDLLPHLTFDTELAAEYAQRINPALQVIKISATGGEGMQQWLDWITAGRRKAFMTKHTTRKATNQI